MANWIDAGTHSDLMPKGRRVLMIKDGASGTETAPATSLVVVQNWSEETKRLPPAKEPGAHCKLDRRFGLLMVTAEGTSDRGATPSKGL